MHRLIVVILSAVDAAIAAAVGIAATLAPLTLLWVLGMGGTADWGLLWPTSATVWQFGNLVPLQVTLPGDYLAVAGIDPGAASFVLSLAPLAFASFTAIFAARSGVRASQADAWVTGVITGSLGFAALTARDRPQLRQRPRRGRAVAGDPVPLARVRDSTARRRGGHRVARSGLGFHRAGPRPHRGGAARVGGGARAHRARRRGRARRADRAGRTRLRRVARAPGWRGHRALRSRSRRRARSDRDHPRAARVPADPRDLGHGVRRRSGIRGRHRHRRLARRHPARSGSRHSRARRASRVDHPLAAAARPAAGRPGRPRGLDRPVAPRGATGASRMPRNPLCRSTRTRPATPPAARHSRLCWRVSRHPVRRALRSRLRSARTMRRRARTMRRRARNPTRSPIGSARGRSSRSASPCWRPRARP